MAVVVGTSNDDIEAMEDAAIVPRMIPGLPGCLR